MWRNSAASQDFALKRNDCLDVSSLLSEDLLRWEYGCLHLSMNGPDHQRYRNLLVEGMMPLDATRKETPGSSEDVEPSLEALHG